VVVRNLYEARRMRRRRTDSGTVTVEYLILTMLVVISFAIAVVSVANHFVGYYDAVEHVNSLSLP
jgi:hypothetical protein